MDLLFLRRAYQSYGCVPYLVIDFLFYISFVCWSQAAIAVQSNTVHEVKEKSPVLPVQVC
jgi:hypothetical protein